MRMFEYATETDELLATAEKVLDCIPVKNMTYTDDGYFHIEKVFHGWTVKTSKKYKDLSFTEYLMAVDSGFIV